MTLQERFVRYRPFLVALAAILLLTLLPHRPERSGGTVAAGNGPGAEGGAGDIEGGAGGAGGAGPEGGPEGVTTTSAATGPTGATVAAGSTAPGSGSGAVKAPAGGGGAAARPAPAGAARAPAGGASAAPAPTGAGLSSAAALASPDCDAPSKKLRLSFVYAPPCVIPWPAGSDNGGDTAMGVTRDTIRIVMIEPSTNQQQARVQWDETVKLFSHFYRMWGRKIETIWFTKTGEDEVADRADAIKLANMKPFAVLADTAGGETFVNELASRGIMVPVSVGQAKSMLKLAPYIWALGQPDDWISEVNAAEWIGKKLVKRQAKWAGDAVYKTQTRRFGGIIPQSWDPGVFEKEFTKYGGTVVDWQTHDNELGGTATYQERARVVVAKLKSAQVTSVVNFASVFFDIVITKEATAQQYFPEWVLTGWGGADLEILARLMDPAQWQHAFGLSGFPVSTDQPIALNYFFEWYWGEKANQNPNYVFLRFAHWLFNGLHTAGPRLTPPSFRDGIFSIPPSGGAANGAVTSPQVSFGRWGITPWDDYSYPDDFGEVWWDQTARGKDNMVKAEGVGKYWFLNAGNRQPPTKWTTDEPTMFSQAGAALNYPEYPAADRPPNHPCTGCPSTS